jgi:hypothetical protein
MKKTQLIVIFTFLSLCLFGQEDSLLSYNRSCPTNINESLFDSLKLFEEKVVAFDGIIERIEVSRNNTPFYKLKIGNTKHLWTVLMFSNDNNNIGDTIRVVGYLAITEPNETEKAYLDGKYMVIAFGLIDFISSNIMFVNSAQKQKQEWIDGKIPSSQ